MALKSTLRSRLGGDEEEYQPVPQKKTVKKEAPPRERMPEERPVRPGKAAREERDAVRETFDAFDIDEDIFEEALKEEKQEKREALRRKVLSVLISVASLYIVTLIYGVTVTEFSYGDSGQIEAVTLTVEQIEKKQDFNTVLSMYVQARNIYEEILTLDYRVATGNEALEAIAPDYQVALEDVLTVATSINGTTCSAENQQIKNLLYTWMSTYMPDYCKYMITALSQNGTAEGEAAGQEAIACRSQYLEPNFQSITQNVITIGSGIEGVDLEDITSWSPEDVAKKIQGTYQ